MSEQSKKSYGLFGGSESDDDTMLKAVRTLAAEADGDGSIYVVVEPVNQRMLAGISTFFNQEGFNVANDLSGGVMTGREITASVIHLFGGNPADYISRLEDTEEWSTIKRAVDRGAALVASSGGAEALGVLARNLTVHQQSGLTEDAWLHALGMFPRTFVGTHWNGDLSSGDPAKVAFRHEFNDWLSGGVGSEYEFVAIDERTGLVGDGSAWHVVGHGQVHRRISTGWRDFGPGEQIDLKLV